MEGCCKLLTEKTQSEFEPEPSRCEATTTLTCFNKEQMTPSLCFLGVLTIETVVLLFYLQSCELLIQHSWLIIHHLLPPKVK